MSQRQRGRPARAPFSGPVPLARPPALRNAGWQGVAVSPSRENHLRQKWGLVQKHPAHSSWTAHSQDRPAWVTKDQGPPGGSPGCSSPPRLRARLPPGEQSPHSTACWSRPPLAVLLWVTPAAPRAGREPVTHPHHPALSSQTPGVNSPTPPPQMTRPPRDPQTGARSWVHPFASCLVTPQLASSGHRHPQGPCRYLRSFSRTGSPHVTRDGRPDRVSPQANRRATSTPFRTESFKTSRDGALAGLTQSFLPSPGPLRT